MYVFYIFAYLSIYLPGEKSCQLMPGDCRIPLAARARLEFTPAPETYLWQNGRGNETWRTVHYLLMYLDCTSNYPNSTASALTLCLYFSGMTHLYLMVITCIRLAFGHYLLHSFASYLQLYCILGCQQLCLLQYFLLKACTTGLLVVLPNSNQPALVLRVLVQHHSQLLLLLPVLDQPLDQLGVLPLVRGSHYG